MSHELAAESDENDTFEPDTDSAIPGELVKQALNDTDPERAPGAASNGSITPRASPAADQEETVQHRSYEPPPSGDIPSVTAGPPGPKRSPGSSDEMFPSLVPVTAGANDWASWNPEGIFEPMGEQAEQPAAGARHDTLPVPMMGGEGPTTDPLGNPTLLIDRPPVPTAEDVTPMLYEPELPEASEGKTARHPVDDGPTQVDFSLDRDPSAISGPTPIHIGVIEAAVIQPSVSDRDTALSIGDWTQLRPAPEPAPLMTASQRDTEAEIVMALPIAPSAEVSSPVPMAPVQAGSAAPAATAPTDRAGTPGGRVLSQPHPPAPRTPPPHTPLPLKAVDIPPTVLRALDPDLSGRADTVIREVSSPHLEATLLNHVEDLYRETMPDREKAKDVVIIRTYPSKEIRRLDIRIAVGLVLLAGTGLLLLLALLWR
jgi:hypothetical protein